MTVSVARIFNANIFEVLNARADEVIDAIIYTWETAEDMPQAHAGEQRFAKPRKNDGFWDF